MSELIDNSRYRIEILKEVIRSLHDGADPETLKGQFRDLLDEVGPSEIAAMENALMAEGMPREEVQRMCDVHAAVLGDALEGAPPPEAVPGHPVHTFRRENERVREIVAAYREFAGSLQQSGRLSSMDEWRDLHDQLSAVDVHYQRKEYLVFPYLEKAGIAGPPKVMWGVHDEIREKVTATGELLDQALNLSSEELKLAVDAVVSPMLDQVESMTGKEDKILWPMAMQHLSDQDWGAVLQQWDQFGEGLAEPAGSWMPPLPVFPPSPVTLPANDAIQMPSGHLSLRQLTAILNTLPMDVTFVNAEGRVAYFTEGSDRIFARNRAIIGRKVEDCHPPKSVHIVERVVDDLSSGRRDVAEFWIPLQGRFVHIRYFAVRADDGEFLGTLEVTQDIAPLRDLEGERRLLAELPGDGGAA
jgi:DUF438 domain-containing protein